MWWGAPNPGRLLNAIADRLLPPVQLPQPARMLPTAGPQFRASNTDDRTIFEAGFGVTPSSDNNCGFVEYLRRGQ